MYMKSIYSTLVTDSSKSRHTITQPCVAHRPKVTPGQPDHLSTRGAVSRHDVRPHTTFTVRTGEERGTQPSKKTDSDSAHPDLNRSGRRLELVGREDYCRRHMFRFSPSYSVSTPVSGVFSQCCHLVVIS